jgi:hypothetical protein
MSCFILSLDELLLAFGAVVRYSLLVCTIPAYHRETVDYLVFFDCVDIMAFLTSEGPATTCVPDPAEVEFIVVARSS